MACSGEFSAKLGARNGQPAREVFFVPVTTSETGNGNNPTYTNIMIDECKKFDMKPVCDHPNYCKNSADAFYIGQDHHVEHGGHMNNNGYFPSGWSIIRDRFKNLCAFTANHGGHNQALCHDGGGGHQWRTPEQNNKIICAGLTSPVIETACTHCETTHVLFKESANATHGVCYEKGLFMGTISSSSAGAVNTGFDTGGGSDTPCASGTALTLTLTLNQTRRLLITLNLTITPIVWQDLCTATRMEACG